MCDDFGTCVIIFIIFIALLMFIDFCISHPLVGISIIIALVIFGIALWLSPAPERQEEQKKKLALEEQEKEKETKLAAKLAFEEEQRSKGLVKFVDRSGNEKWGTPEQVKDWRAIDIGMKNGFAEISPIDFEKFIGDLFRKMGYQVYHTPATGDYGADLVVKDANNIIVVQVKKYNPNNRIGAQIVQQTLGSMWKYNANKAIIVTTSYFTQRAREQARNAPIELWNRDILYGLIDKYYLSIDIPTVSSSADASSEIGEIADVSSEIGEIADASSEIGEIADVSSEIGEIADVSSEIGEIADASSEISVMINRYYIDDIFGWGHIILTVINNTSRPITNIRVHLTYLDSSDKIVGADDHNVVSRRVVINPHRYNTAEFNFNEDVAKITSSINAKITSFDFV